MSFLSMILKMKKWMLATILALMMPLLHAADGNLESVLQQMNVGAAKFQSFQADMEWSQYQAVVRETNIQKGWVVFQRKSTEIMMAMHFLEENGKPVPKVVLFRDNQLKFYQPMIKQLTIVSLGSNRAQYESFLTLGFGASGSDLQKKWDVSYLGSEQINGIQTAKLQLLPKEDEVKRNVKTVVIWVDLSRDISLKQQFTEPSGDSRTVTYSNIRYNQPIKKDSFELKLAPGTQTVNK